MPVMSQAKPKRGWNSFLSAVVRLRLPVLPTIGDSLRARIAGRKGGIRHDLAHVPDTLVAVGQAVAELG